MKQFLCKTLLICAWAGLAHAADFATTADAQAMVKKAIAHVKAAGKPQAYADFTAKKPDYINQDLYVVVFDLTGTVLANGQNIKMVGKNMIDLKDIDGKPFVQDLMKLAKTNPSFWEEYKYTDPITGKVLPKSLYCEKMDDAIVCAGIYKR